MNDNCFRFIRYILAISLVSFHFCVLTNHTFFWPIDGDVVVKSFFVLAGFFCIPSYQRRKSLKDYYLHRLRVIYPPYALAVIMGFLIAFALTNVEKTAFLTRFSTVKYLISNLLTLNFLQPNLDGVFSCNSMQAVNGSLWFIKVLLALYLITPIISYLIKRFGKLRAISSLYVLSIIYVLACDYLYQRTGQELFSLMRHQFGGQLLFYVSGIAVYQSFSKLQGHLQITLLLSAITCTLSFTYDRVCWLIQPVSLAFTIGCLGCLLPKLNQLCPKRDVTYGIYLLHFPIIQALIQQHIESWNTAICYLLTLVITIAGATILQLITSCKSSENGK